MEALEENAIAVSTQSFPPPLEWLLLRQKGFGESIDDVTQSVV